MFSRYLEAAVVSPEAIPAVQRCPPQFLLCRDVRLQSMLQAVLSMFYSVQSILKSMQKQEDVYEEFVGQQDVTNEILEDVTKEEKEESYK